MERTDIVNEERENIRERINELLPDTLWAEQRSVMTGDEFNRLEVQIAAFIVTLSGFFIVNDEFDGTFLLRFAYAISMSFLLASLACGLLHIKNREKFTDIVLMQRAKRLRKWRDAYENKISFKEALAFQEGSSLGDSEIIAEPAWTWILQTVFLGVGVSGLFIISLIVLFK